MSETDAAVAGAEKTGGENGGAQGAQDDGGGTTRDAALAVAAAKAARAKKAAEESTWTSGDVPLQMTMGECRSILAAGKAIGSKANGNQGTFMLIDDVEAEGSGKYCMGWRTPAGGVASMRVNHTSLSTVTMGQPVAAAHKG